MQVTHTGGFGARQGAIDAPCVIVTAHPDDETLGAAAVLQRARACVVLHLTDGAPRDASLRSCMPALSRSAYAQLRQDELSAALRLAGVERDRVRWLGAIDQEACLSLCDLTRRLVAALQRLRPAFVVAHTYEGGHPDHDAACFVAHAALDLLRRRSAHAPVLYEMAGYHAARGRLIAGQFISAPATDEFALALSPREQMCKREMLACFASQSEVVSALAPNVAVERYRCAPRHDFSRPPHPGATHYETLGWRVSAREFSRLACVAARELGAGGVQWDSPF